MPRVLKTHIAAQRLGVHVETLKRWLKEGRIRGFKTEGGHWRIPETEISKRVSLPATNRNTGVFYRG